MVITERDKKRGLPVSVVLHSLAVEQRNAFQTGDSCPIATNTTAALLAWFRENAFLGEILDTDVDPAKLGAKFAGGVHHTMAYMALATLTEQQPFPHVLLSPERTLRLYERLYPHVGRLPRAFKSDVLDHAHVPDGVVVALRERARLVASCEYTLDGRRNRFMGKYREFRRAKRHYPHLFTDTPSLLFVVPRGSSLLTIQVPHVTFYEMPYTHEEFRSYTNDLYVEYQRREEAFVRGEVASEEDIAGRIEKQLRRAAELYRKREETPQWREYRRNHKDQIEALC